MNGEHIIMTNSLNRGSAGINLNTDEIRLVLWPWGRDVTNSVSAIRYAENNGQLAAMAEDVITGAVDGHPDIVAALATRAHEVPVDHHFQLASLFPECLELSRSYCCRQDALPERLELWSENGMFANELVYNRNTNQRTIDKLLVRAVRAADVDISAYYLLAQRASLAVLESLMTMDAPCQIKYALSQRTNDQHLLDRLAHDPDVIIQRNVATNEATPAALLSRVLFSSDDRKLLIYVAERTTSVQDLEYLAHRLCDLKWRELAAAIMKNPHSTDVAKAIAVMVETEG